MQPAARLLEHLTAARRDGHDFADAWPRAVAAAVAEVTTRSDVADWQTAFSGTRESWQAAFERRPPERRERALAVVADDPEHGEPIPDGARLCERCDKMILAKPNRTGRLPIYCSESCRRAASVERLALAA